MITIMLVIAFATALVSCEARDEGDSAWMFWLAIGCASIVMTYFIFR